MSLIEAKQIDHVLVLSLNRPEKRNAFHPALIQALIEAFKQAEKLAGLKAIFIHGNGEHFCAGADIDHMRQVGQMNEKDNQQDAARIAEMLQTIALTTLPVIAFAHGTTLGGGLGILAVSDIVIAVDNAQFGFSEINLGLAPSTISPYVVQAIGQRAAQYYFLTGKRFDTQEAMRVGLVHHSILDHERKAVMAQYCDQFNHLSRQALIANKKLLQTVGNKSIPNDITQFTIDHLSALRKSEDAQEGLLAFLEKRRPHWQ